MKRLLTVQDISCVGKCSLTVALPIISALGVEASVLPTAVLSAHTMFQNYTCKDLTDQIEPITNHWKQEHIDFSAIYTGYLATPEQVSLMENLFDDFKTENNFIFVDPVMADNGVLYAGFDNAFPKQIARLCSKADIIVPNLTEACLLTETEYREDYDHAYVEKLLEKVCALGSRITILTGVSAEEGKTGVMGYDRMTGETFCYSHEKLPVSFQGTGDIFSSTCVGAMVRGMSWKEAVGLAADYTAECIRLTMADPAKPWYGVNFEQAIPYLIKRLS